jgi:hypothetical protein
LSSSQRNKKRSNDKAIEGAKAYQQDCISKNIFLLIYFWKMFKFYAIKINKFINKHFMSFDFLWQLISKYSNKIKFEHLQQTLFLLKNYPTLNVCATKWQVDIKTFDKWLWEIIKTLSSCLNTVSILHRNIFLIKWNIKLCFLY